MLDTTVSGCFDRMTIASTNPCAVAWLDRFGRQNLNDFVYRLGFSRAVTFTHAQATHVSAGDLTKFMVGLETGSLISGAQRERLLYSLSYHPYRYGGCRAAAGAAIAKLPPSRPWAPASRVRRSSEPTERTSP